MSKELATKNLIHDKISSFPGANGADVLLTRKEIEETSLAVVTGSCLQNEIPIMDNVIGVESWEYVFSIDRTSANVANTGESVRVNITSYKKKYIGGIDTGETQPVGYSVQQDIVNFSSVDTSGYPSYVTFNVNENTNTSSRTDYWYFVQEENINRISFIIRQDAGSVTYELRVSTTPSSLFWDADDTATLDPKIEGVFRTTINGNVTSQVVTRSLSNIRIVSQDDAARYNYTIEIAVGPIVRVTPNTIGIYAGSFVVGASYLGYDNTTNVTLNHGT